MGLLEQLVITLREGVEAALIVAIALAYLRKTGRERQERTVYAALAAAVLVSLAGAIAMSLGHWNEDRFEGWLMLAAAVFVFTTVWWMHRTARFLRQGIEARLARLQPSPGKDTRHSLSLPGASPPPPPVGRRPLAAPGSAEWADRPAFLPGDEMGPREGPHSSASILPPARQLGRHRAWAWGLFLFIFLMVLREGVETVLMLSAVSLDSTEMLAWLGGVIGLLLAVAFGVAFVRGSIRISLAPFFRITTAILVVIGVQLLVAGVHELMEAGVMPSSAREMALVGPIVANDTFFFLVILGLAGILLFREHRAQRITPATGGTATPAAQRKAAARARSERRWSRLAYSGAFLFLILIGAEYAYTSAASQLTPAEPLSPVAGWVSLPAASILDGRLHRYEVTTPSGPVRFFALRRPDGIIVVALDACQVCGSQGYYQVGSQLYCRHCRAPINAAMVGMAGGCNPIPLAAQRRGDVVMVRLADLAGQAFRFESH